MQKERQIFVQDSIVAGAS